MVVKVLNKRVDFIPEDSVYIGRPSKWGNPFVVGKDGTRHDVVMKYRKYLLENKQLLCDLVELKDKNIVCWCSPQLCHGDILKELYYETVD